MILSGIQKEVWMKKIETLVKNNLTPFYVYSSDSIKENFNLLKKNLGKNIYYSVKANSNQTIISFRLFCLFTLHPFLSIHQ